MLGKIFSQTGGIAKALGPGDTLSQPLIASSLATAGAGTITAAMIVSGLIIRTAAGADRVDTTDTAVNIMNALLSNTGVGPEVGESFSCIFSQQSAGGWKSTIAGGAGVTLVGLSGNILTDTARTLVFTCTAKGVNTFASGVWTNVGATFNVTVL